MYYSQSHLHVSKKYCLDGSLVQSIGMVSEEGGIKRTPRFPTLNEHQVPQIGGNSYMIRGIQSEEDNLEGIRQQVSGVCILNLIYNVSYDMIPRI